MMAYTPGPWSCDYGDFAVYCDTGAEVCAVTQGNHDDGTNISATEMEANLNLIAAAPELLQACQRLLTILVDVYEDDFYRHGEPSEDAWPSVIGEARASIAKAEGKAR